MEELRDRNGLTEAEFLARYDASKYDRPSVTVDIIIISGGKILLIKRGGHPCLGKLAFPGGFIEADEDVYSAAVRELKEETGLDAINLRQLNVASRPGRDPRTRIITVPFLADIKDMSALSAGDDAMSAKWYPFSYKKTVLDGVTVFEISIIDGEETKTVKVSCLEDESGVREDLIFKQHDASSLAGDHAEIFAYALDIIEKSKINTEMGKNELQ